MIRLKREDLGDWMHRFDDFNDATLARWAMEYYPAHRLVTLDILVWDWESSTEWSHLRIFIHKVKHSSFVHGPKLSFSLLYGFHLLFEGDEIGVELGDFQDPPKSLKELVQSKGFVVGEFLEWEATPYRWNKS